MNDKKLNIMCNRTNDEESQRGMKYFSSQIGLLRRASPDTDTSGVADSFSTGSRFSELLSCRDLDFMNSSPSPPNLLPDNSPRRREWSATRRVAEVSEMVSNQKNTFVESENDRDLEESSVSSQEMAVSPAGRSVVFSNISVTVILGGKKSRRFKFTKSVVLAADILERLEKMFSETEYDKFNLPKDIEQIRLMRNDQVLQGGDELKEGDLVYALTKSTTGRGVSVDDEKETRSSRRRKNIHKILETLTPARQRQRHRIRPLFYNQVSKRQEKTDEFEDVISRTSEIEFGSRPCPLNSLPEAMIPVSTSSKDYIMEEGRKPSPKSYCRSELQRLKTKLHNLESENYGLKVENEELRKLFHQTLTQNKLERNMLEEVEGDLKRKKKEMSSLSSRNKELSVESKRLLEEKCRLYKKVKALQLQLDNEKKYSNIMGMGVTLPKEVPKDQEKLEKTIDALETLITKLRKEQIENYKNRMTCTICWDRNWNTALIPCGHCLCAVCARRLTNCPQCRKHIDRRQRMPIQPLKLFVL